MTTSSPTITRELPATDLGAGRRLHAHMILTDARAYPSRYCAVHCTLMDGAITCELAPEDSGPTVTYRADDAFGRILAELMAMVPPAEDADPPS